MNVLLTVFSELTGKNQLSVLRCIGNKSVPKTVIHDTNLFLTAISIFLITNHNSLRVLFDKIASVYFI